MKKTILSLLFLISAFASFGQSGSQALSGVFLRVNDTTTYQAAAATRHSQGYHDIYFNNQATTPHFDIWNGSSYDHVFDFNAGGGGSGTVESVTGDGVDNTDPDNPVLTFPVASEVVNTPAGGIAATDVQAALNELDTDKQAALVSGTNIKTVGGTSLLGSGNVTEVTQTITNGVTTTSPSEDAVFDALALKAPLASPTFTGTPAAPTASPGTNTTQLATTAFVTAAALPAATSSNDGYLTSTDWSTFNGKQDNLTLNSANSRSFGGTWTAPGNNAYHIDRSGTFTARGTASDNLIGYKDTETLIAAAATQNLIGNLQTPNFNVNGQTNIRLVGNRYAPTVTGSAGSHVSYLIESGAVVIGHTSLTSGVTGLQVRGTDNTTGQVIQLESLSGSTRFQVQSNGLSNHFATFTTGGTGASAFGYGGTLTGRASNPDVFTSVHNQQGLVIGANSQTAWAYDYTGAINDPGFTTTTIGGYLFNPSITNTPDAIYGFVSAPTTSLSGFGLSAPTATIHVVGTTKLDGSVTLPTAGNGFLIKTGTNATFGTSTLVGGTVTVNTTKTTASSVIILTSQTDGGTPGFLRVSARSAGTSFTVTSSSGSDTSTFGWLLIEPAP